jgi:hypothetical protein
MAETTTSIPQKGLWTVKATDFLKGLWMAVGSSVIAFGFLIINNHWHLPSFDQLEPYLNAFAIAFLTYIGKNAVTNNVGEILKKDKPVVHVDASELASLQQKASEA